MVNNGNDIGIDPCIALDSNNIPHIRYYDQASRDLKYAKLSGSPWHVETVDTIGNVGVNIGNSFSLACKNFTIFTH